VRTFSSLAGRRVVTEDGRTLGRCYDLVAARTSSSLTVTELVVGRRGFLQHLGLRQNRDTIPWDAVVRIEGERIVVRDPWRST